MQFTTSLEPGGCNYNPDLPNLIASKAQTKLTTMKSKKVKIDFRKEYNSTIFTKVYRNNHWGGNQGEFYSGPGSHNEFVNGYATKVAEFIKESSILKIVEIGCGDFNVTGKILSLLDIVGHDYSYIGYDLVKPLVKRNEELFGSVKTKFICKDSCIGKIADGDLLVIRQVLQHLNNKSIKQIIEKFDNYRYVIFTEHQPLDEDVIPNKEIRTGSSTRLNINSGVYLDKEPFNCIIDRKLYSILEPSLGIPGSINTFVIDLNK